VLSCGSGDDTSFSLDGVVGLVDIWVGVVGRILVDGEEGDSGRRNGEVLDEPKESGEGL
jgi:hypothetical protein